MNSQEQLLAVIAACYADWSAGRVALLSIADVVLAVSLASMAGALPRFAAAWADRGKNAVWASRFLGLAMICLSLNALREAASIWWPVPYMQESLRLATAIFSAIAATLLPLVPAPPSKLFMAEQVPEDAHLR